jgi:Right handed beta helix region
MSRSLRRPSRPRPTFRPRLECLESRTVLSTFTVANLNDGGPGSLRQAILDANTQPGDDTVTFAPGVTGAINLASALPDLSSNIDLEGPGAASLTVQPASGGLFRVFHVTAGATVTLTGLTIADGSADVGGGILNDGGTLTVSACAVTGDTAQVNGGGIASTGTLTVVGSVLSGNAVNSASGTQAFGGGIYSTGTLTVSASILFGNSATAGAAQAAAYGGGIYAAGALAVTNSSISQNTVSAADAEGGGLFITHTVAAAVTASTVLGNAGGYALTSYDTYAAVTVTGSTISGNGGGGILSDGFNSLVVVNSSITYNGGSGIANGPGSGATVTGTLISGNTVTDDYGAKGGAIANSGSLTITGCTLSNNTVRGRYFAAGGAVYIIGGSLSISDSTLSGNSTVGDANSVNLYGGAIYSADNGPVTITRCTIEGNTSRQGGGIYLYSSGNSGMVDVRDSTLSDNTATADGGAILNGGTLTVLNSTLSGNTAVNGGGIDNAGDTTLVNVTVSGNTAAGAGGGFLNETYTVMVYDPQTHSFFQMTQDRPNSVANTILAGNHGPASSPDVQGQMASQGHNLIGDGTGASGLTAPGDQVGSAAAPIDPRLGPLQNNGGPTATMALLPGSPAINAGSNAIGNASGLTTDQRGPGFSRFVGPVDIGAFEVQPVTPTLTGISPTSATAGDSATTITLTGSSFVNSSTADFNGAAIATTFVSATQLTAVIPASDLTTAGAESITVVTAGPGGGTSAAQTFTVNVAPPPPPPSQQSLPPFVSVAFGPLGEVIELVNSAGVLTQFDGAGAHQLGNGGVRSASIAFGPNGYVLEVVSTAGILTQFDATGAHQLGGAGVESASVAFGPGGPVLEVVLVDGSLRQFSAAGVQLLASSGVISASVAFGPGGEVVDMVSTAGFLTQYDAAGVHPFGGAGVQSAGVAFFANNEVLDIIFSDGTLDQFDVFGVHRLGMVP